LTTGRSTLRSSAHRGGSGLSAAKRQKLAENVWDYSPFQIAAYLKLIEQRAHRVGASNLTCRSMVGAVPIDISPAETVVPRNPLV
jgi:hypothetical protein